MLGQKLNRNGKQSPVLQGILILFVVINICMCIYMVVSPIIKLEHYNRVYQNPLTVTATVTEHKSYDDDGDTDYKSYISYEVNGVRYTGISFENKNEKDQLTPVGKQVTVQVSPEDPSALISKLKGAWGIMVVGIAFSMGMVSMGWRGFLHSGRTQAAHGTPEQEELQRDLRLTVFGRVSVPLWLLLGIGYTFMCLRYPAAAEEWVLIVAAVCGMLWLWSMYRAVRDLKTIKNEEYELRRDVLIRKEDNSDSESESYALYYKSGDKTWRTNTTKAKYNAAKEGSVVLAVYLPGAKKPILHYDMDGDAS